MDKYAEGKVIETATGYIVSIGEPIVNDTFVAGVGDDHVVLAPAENAPVWDQKEEGQYLVTFEVNGTVVAQRELMKLTTDGVTTIGDYEIGEDGYINCEGGDVFHIVVEPVEVLTTDAFRAAVKKSCNCGAASESSGGGTGGGVLVATDTDGTLDVSYQDIEDAGFFAVLHTPLSETETQVAALSVYEHSDNGYGVMFGEASYNAANKTDYLELELQK